MYKCFTELLLEISVLLKRYLISQGAFLSSKLRRKHFGDLTMAAQNGYPDMNVIFFKGIPKLMQRPNNCQSYPWRDINASDGGMLGGVQCPSMGSTHVSDCVEMDLDGNMRMNMSDKNDTAHYNLFDSITESKKVGGLQSESKKYPGEMGIALLRRATKCKARYNHVKLFMTREQLDQYIEQNKWLRMHENIRKHKGGLAIYCRCSGKNGRHRCGHKMMAIQRPEGCFVAKTTDGGKAHRHE
ncbi:unnamed protein product [Anisakis simplex]|uniref:SWIM-type domain-containing protein n=1 Tax=Anisakis simplex TaxID=6269 RepID=A0A0M3K532_ANISI|nr:unnamed protein product [Anisakis simplex]